MFSFMATRRSVTAFGLSSIQRQCARQYTGQLPTHGSRMLANLAVSSSSQLWASAKPEPTTRASSEKYSQATTARLQGLNAPEELAKLSAKLKTPTDQLRIVLTKQLAAMEPSSTDGEINEKAEYVDWLLSGFVSDGSNGNVIETKGKVKPAGKTSRSSSRSSGQKKSKQMRAMSTASAQDLPDTSSDEQTFATNVKFADRPDLHPQSKRAIAEVMGLTSMTEIQAKTFAAASSGTDVLGRARTGTGKTLAFLLPAIERILQLGTNGKVGILIVSPTRELATQIGDEAEKLTKFHRDMSVQVMFGGTNMKRDVNRLADKLPTILVATPGRLLDHMQSTRIGNLQFGRDIMSQTPVLILDETDRLLDMGFRREISKIMAFLPASKQRQTLLFSATIPPDLKAIMAQNMKPDFIEVDCINDGDAATHTNAAVQQSHVILPANSDRFVSSVVEVVCLALDKYDSAETPAKVVVFFPTARLVNFFAEIFNEGSIASVPVLELHSKKSQGYRNRVSEEFRNTKRGVLFTSDVSARGVDYPNVSHVIQFGLPESRDQYIHRLGRTGRAGLEGKGWLVLSEWESLFLQELKGVNIPVDEELRQLITNPISPEAKDKVEEVRRRVRGGDKVLAKSAKGAYQAFLGYYLGQMRRMRMNRKENLVEIANEFAALAGLDEPPALTKQMVGKMGLKGVSGLIVSSSDEFDNGRSGGRDGGKSNRGHNDGRRAPERNSGGRRR